MNVLVERIYILSQIYRVKFKPRVRTLDISLSRCNPTHTNTNYKRADVIMNLPGDLYHDGP